MALANKNTQTITLNDVIIELEGTIVGGAQSLSFTWEQDNEAQHQGGSKKPYGIKQGQITISGTLEQHWLNTDEIKELVDFENGNSPYFTLIGTTKDRTPERKVKIIDAMFNNVEGSVEMGDPSSITRNFDALDFDMK